ncbi:MAG: histone deacetylase [Cyanobacteria bacterium]|nr:histone deacetylase [Cyanobacteriota bacterium]MDW8200066.1 histone deacetylase [Cyanobacteriota bacterium SKYGB_h_bin112]
MVRVIYSDRFLDHDTGRFHPERPGRLTAIVDALATAPWRQRLTWQQPTPVADRQSTLMSLLHTLHHPDYVASVERLANSGGGRLDPDTVVSAESYDVAMLAVSAWLDGVDHVVQTEQPAFVLARPPGHHALSDRGMGFCLFANAAIAAYYALQQPNVQRVAILDWDVHHGNGTQALVENHPQIAYCSLHEFPNYPGTGRTSEQGAFGNVLNLPMPPGSSMRDYEPLFRDKIVPFFTALQPDVLIVSAGYDANRDDPLAGINLVPENYGVFTRYCLQVTRRILFGLEGGYDFSSLGQSVVATIAACLED